MNGGINTYGYVGGNPVNYIDPQGLLACGGLCVAVAVIGGKAIISTGATYVAARATNASESTARSQAAIAGVTGAFTAPGVGYLVKGPYVSSALTSIIGNGVSQQIINGTIDPYQAAIAGVSALPAAATESALTKVGASAIEANLGGTYIGSVIEGMTNGIIKNWPEPVEGMCQ